MPTPAKTEVKKDFLCYLQIERREVTIERDSKETKFDAYKLIEPNGKKVDLKLVKDFEGPKPKEDCIIVVHVKDFDLVGTDRQKYPCYWVRKITEILPLQKVDKSDDDYKELQNKFAKNPVE